MYSDRNFMIFPVAELPKVDFTQVFETSANTVRKSVDGTKTFVKWDNEPPAFVSKIEGIEGFYNYDEMLVVLDTAEWCAPLIEGF